MHKYTGFQIKYIFLNLDIIIIIITLIQKWPEDNNLFFFQMVKQ